MSVVQGTYFFQLEPGSFEERLDQARLLSQPPAGEVEFLVIAPEFDLHFLSMMIISLAHACFYVSNLERSVQFYRDQLGLTIAFDYRDEDGCVRGLYFYLGQRTFLEMFERAIDGPAERESFRHICMEVDDMDQTVASLRERGVEVHGVARGRDRSHKAWITDPDGNEIELHQYTPDSAQTPWVERVAPAPSITRG